MMSWRVSTRASLPKDAKESRRIGKQPSPSSKAQTSEIWTLIVSQPHPTSRSIIRLLSDFHLIVDHFGLEQ